MEPAGVQVFHVLREHLRRRVHPRVRNVVGDPVELQDHCLGIDRLVRNVRVNSQPAIETASPRGDVTHPANGPTAGRVPQLPDLPVMPILSNVNVITGKIDNLNSWLEVGLTFLRPALDPRIVRSLVRRSEGHPNG